MLVIDAGGESLNSLLFISVYHKARELAPPRFLTLRLHPDRYDDLCRLSVIPESIQMGPTPGPVGRIVYRVACIKPPMGVTEGIAIAQDPKIDPAKLIFEIHGISEMIVENIGNATPSKSS